MGCPFGDACENPLCRIEAQRARDRKRALRAAIRELMEDCGLSRKEAVAFVDAYGTEARP
jgi:DNA-directed RNA polymerase subunit L